jgi:hypothetical protein
MAERIWDYSRADIVYVNNLLSAFEFVIGIDAKIKEEKI